MEGAMAESRLRSKVKRDGLSKCGLRRPGRRFGVVALFVSGRGRENDARDELFERVVCNGFEPSAVSSYRIAFNA
jgi:hypothetical protein